MSPLTPDQVSTGKQSWAVLIGHDRVPMDPRNMDFVLESARKWHKTPQDGLGGPGNSGRQGGENLRTAVNGQLNPAWVEWLMGYPPEWTVLEGWATRSSRKSSSGLAKGSLKRRRQHEEESQEAGAQSHVEDPGDTLAALNPLRKVVKAQVRYKHDLLECGHEVEVSARPGRMANVRSEPKQRRCWQCRRALTDGSRITPSEEARHTDRDPAKE